jgi:hypothetical protein
MTSVQRYTETKIPMPTTYFPAYNTRVSTGGSTFIIKPRAGELSFFIGPSDTGSSDISIGLGTLSFSSGTSEGNNIIIGNTNLQNITSTNINRNTIIGYNNTSTGLRSLNNIFGSQNTLGTYINSSIFGNSTSVTGSNQNQIGGSITTTYTYGTVQNRSDVRDKIDIEDIPIGVNFINKLKPKFYRWNYREDYIQRDLSGNEIILKQDGTKKGKRFHAGLIAQDVKESMDELSIDFGVYQDHLVNGGKDVKTLGYGELIPVLIKAVQELSAKNTELENRIKILENK